MLIEVDNRLVNTSNIEEVVKTIGRSKDSGKVTENGIRVRYVSGAERDYNIEYSEFITILRNNSQITYT